MPASLIVQIAYTFVSSNKDTHKGAQKYKMSQNKHGHLSGMLLSLKYLLAESYII